MADHWEHIEVLQAEIAELGPPDATAYQLWMEKHYHDTVTVYHPTRLDDNGNTAAVVIPVGNLSSKLATGFTLLSGAAATKLSLSLGSKRTTGGSN